MSATQWAVAHIAVVISKGAAHNLTKPPPFLA